MTAIEACPPLAAGDGAVVTGRYITRGAGKLVRVTLDDGSDLVGTAQHPIWSQSRRAWTPLGELLPGEHLPGRAGPLAVLSVVPLPGVADVYNLEIHGQHVYAITAAGVLVHNATGRCTPDVITSRTPLQRRTLYHYTDEKGLKGITDSQSLRASTKARNPGDVRYGNGQYVSDIVPGTKTPAQLSREFLGSLGKFVGGTEGFVVRWGV